MELWPHQVQGIRDVQEAVRQGYRRILLTSPTGGGKSKIMIGLIQSFLAIPASVGVYVNRKLLVQQMSDVFRNAELDHGIRAAGYPDDRHMPLQISSIQTERSRVVDQKRWELHDSKFVLIDEAHLMKGATAREIIDRHVESGCIVIGLTATPIDLGGLYETLIVAGRNSQLRQCGALVPCYHYGCDEPDLRRIKRVKLGDDLTENENRKAIMTPTILGRVFDWFDRLNPDRKPTILFAPGVKESVWFAEQFHKRGIAAAHIDGADAWVDGQFVSAGRDTRREIIDRSQTGDIKIVCNRFVLREGIDMPWLAHGIFATVFGSLQSYLQSGGRLIRAFPGLEKVTLQDHGGNWWRHGSLNADRIWNLDDTSESVVGMHQDKFREKEAEEPRRCPVCGQIVVNRRFCPCGVDLAGTKKSRPVIMADGTISHYQGDIFPPIQRKMKADTNKIWRSMYYRAKAGNMTFRQAMGLFFAEHGYYPPKSLPLMPANGRDWFRKVADVPYQSLRS